MSNICDFKPFIVDDGMNTSYIDSLLMALFYTPTIVELTMLKSTPIHEKFIYIQETIKDKFINVVRCDNSVSLYAMNDIRNNMIMCGWSNIDDICKQHDVCEFYDFLIKNLSDQYIDIKYSKTLQNLIETQYISLNITESSEIITIKDLFKNWSHNDTCDVNNDTCDVNNDTCDVNTYVQNTPRILPFKINRYVDGKKINTRVDIKKKIKIFTKNSEYSNADWFFHSAICHVGNTLTDGHYYCLIQTTSSKWLIFDNKNIPCMTEIKMDDECVINKIMSECVFIIYGYRTRTN